jgi:methionyl-tRNA formyltransferase
MRVAAIGRTHWLYDAIELVAARGHDIVLIGTAASAPEYRRHPDDFTALAAQLGCPSFVHGALGDPSIDAQLRRARADVAISVNWPTIITAATRQVFPLGVLNAHAGALPRFRGNACPNWAILNGESHVGVTVHEMVDELDAGPVLAQTLLPLAETDYIGDVYAQLDARIPRLFADVIDGLASGALVAHPQADDPQAALRCHPRQPVDGRIDWSQPAWQIARLVRASAEPFAGAFAQHHGRTVIVWRAQPTAETMPRLGVPGQIIDVDHTTGAVRVLCGEGVLEVQEVEVASQRDRAARFFTSTRDRFTSADSAELQQLRDRVAQLEARVAALLAAR